MNVLNVELDQGATERHLFEIFYDPTGDDWRAQHQFSACVLKPLEWAGMIFASEQDITSKREQEYFKTPLWRSALKLETDEQLSRPQLH
jgi:hypothetical protein